MGRAESKLTRRKTTLFIMTTYYMPIFGVSPFSSYKTTLKQQLNGEKVRCRILFCIWLGCFFWTPKQYNTTAQRKAEKVAHISYFTVSLLF